MTGYCIATIYKWISIYKKEKRLTAKPDGHRQPIFSQSEHEQVKTMIQEKPDITLVEIRERLNKKCCLDAVYNMVNRLGMTFKKTLKASEQDRPDVVQKREEWREFQKNTPGKRIIFIDESAAKTNMIRLYGRSIRGKRCFDKTPHKWKTITMLSSIRSDGHTESIIFKGALNKKIFELYVEKVLAPSLRPGDIVVMDNFSAHKSQKVEEIINSCHAELRFLPPYSPEFNPIEKMWSKVKQILRGLMARAEESLFASIGTALSQVTAADARGWYGSCGYVIPEGQNSKMKTETL